jgi:hypothetical protein
LNTFWLCRWWRRPSWDARARRPSRGDCEGLNLSGRDDALLDAQSRPPSRWPPGALVRDTVRIETPGRIATGEVGVWLGLAMGGNQRYKVIGTAEAGGR